MRTSTQFVGPALYYIYMTNSPCMHLPIASYAMFGLVITLVKDLLILHDNRQIIELAHYF